jgi:hypothetical protein
MKRRQAVDMTGLMVNRLGTTTVPSLQSWKHEAVNTLMLWVALHCGCAVVCKRVHA